MKFLIRRVQCSGLSILLAADGDWAAVAQFVFRCQVGGIRSTLVVCWTTGQQVGLILHQGHDLQQNSPH